MSECCSKENESINPGGEFRDCMLCGKPLRYEKKASMRRCSICGEEKLSNCACEDGHYVCDACHAAGLDQFFVPFLLKSDEKCPLTLLEQVMAMPQVHMHGPEHHAIVPCVLLTAYHNCGGGNDLKEDLAQALERGKQVPGGICGYWGVCGAAAGAGIYMSILTGSNPLNGTAWAIPQKLTARCMNALSNVGGPRCCKRTCRLAIREAAAFTAELFGVEMPLTEIRCTYCGENKECIGRACPFFPVKETGDSALS
ncbi:MAG: hypothetical protein K6C08_14950 [Oscillospiraceae bacterium]|nr:hypothetical protein [Oscillospiraceae bacterium]